MRWSILGGAFGLLLALSCAAHANMVQAPPPHTGSVGCNGIGPQFGLTCDASLSDEFNGTSLDPNKWVLCNECVGPPPFVGGGVATIPTSKNSGFIGASNLIPPAPNYYEIRIQFVGPNNQSATWNETDIIRNSNCVFFKPCEASPGEKTETDLMEGKFGGARMEQNYFQWNCVDHGVFPYTDCQTGASGTQIGSTIVDGTYHVIGYHRYFSGSTCIVDFYLDGRLDGTRNSDGQPGECTLAQTPTFWEEQDDGQASSINIDYVRNFH